MKNFLEIFNEKLQFVKPKLGKRPEWIDDAKT